MGDGVGRITHLFTFPVKGMAGVPVDEARIGFHGIDGDRRLAFQILNDPSGLPWVSGREVPWLGALRPILDNAGSGIAGALNSDGTFVERGDLLARIGEAVRGKTVHVTRLYRGTFDSMPVSLITKRNVETLDGLTTASVVVEQLRANIVLDSELADKRLVGMRLAVASDPGGVRLEVVRQTQRCPVVATAPATGKVDTLLYSRVRDELRNKLGVYATVVRAGSTHVGDVLIVASQTPAPTKERRSD